MYKILSLNSLISAYTMSALYLDGVKMGDYQATAMGMGISILFLMMSFSQPLKKLEKEKPPSSIFHWSLTISVSIQFIMHLSVLIYLVQLCEPFIDRHSDDSLIPDGEFKPNVKNSVLFLYQWWLQCTVFFVNYTGRPFMQDLKENKKLYNYIRLMFGVAICGILDWSDIVRDYLELVPFPNSEFQYKVIAVLCADFAVCYGVDSYIKKLYLRTFK
jgi:cation-transporting ATPase 13A1